MVMTADEAEAILREREQKLEYQYVATGKEQTMRRRAAKDIEPVVDDVINAKARGYGCFRKPFLMFFEQVGGAGKKQASMQRMDAQC